jgi:hypothetical protein
MAQSHYKCHAIKYSAVVLDLSFQPNELVAVRFDFESMQISVYQCYVNAHATLA